MAPEEGEEAEGVSLKTLRQMQRVANQAAERDRGEAERDLREWKNADKKGFYNRLTALEAAVVNRQAAQQQKEPAAGPDLVTEKVVGLVNALLAEHEEEEKARALDRPLA